MAEKKRSATKNNGDFGSYIVLNGRRLELEHHDTDFSLMVRPEMLEALKLERAEALSPNVARVRTDNSRERDKAMADARKKNVAHHIYKIRGTDEEVIIDNKIILSLRQEGTGELERIMDEYNLEYVRRMGTAHVLKVTLATGENPLKVANQIADRPEVAECSPQLMLEMQFHDTPALFPEQWYLTTDFFNHVDVVPGVDINAPLAWQFGTGSVDIVVAVIDDGFDLGHPVFGSTRIHPEKRDFMGVDNEPTPGSDDYHGTPVASITVGSHENGVLKGIAPGCMFLPIRIGFGPFASHIDILDVFEYVSERADVVNCSFGIPPSSFDKMSQHFRNAITELTKTGGKRGKGLVMVFSAANDDAPTFLDGANNVNGVLFTRRGLFGLTTIAEIAAGQSVFSGYPMTEGVIAVGAMSSLGRKAGYSCWGPHVTVCAPSNNMHYIPAFVEPGSDSRRDLFITNYRGLGQVAASNRPGHGHSFSPITDDPATPSIEENLFTRDFGGTSGAAPVVTGVVALMLSANSELTADQVRHILMATADRNLDATLDLIDDPNVQGFSGEFVGGRSIFFGSGKVDAFRAVERAKALVTGSQVFDRLIHANLSIPDNLPQGVTSHVEVDAVGRLTEISVSVDIIHTWRGDLIVTLVTPEGIPATLHSLTGGASENLQSTYSNVDTDSLRNLVIGRALVQGRWTLHVSDNLRRDIGVLNSWRLSLRSG